MTKRLPPLNALKYFESAARHLSFTKAAEELFVTQAAISHQIKLLEDFLGLSLFKRKNRALELTEEGGSYYQDVKSILRKLAEVTEKLRGQKDARQLTISVPQSFGIHWLVPRLSEFNQQHADIEVRVKGLDQDEGLLNGEIDVAVYYGRGNWADLQVESLADGNLQILAAPKLLQKTPLNSADDLRHHVLIHVYTRDNWKTMLAHLQVENVNIQHGPLFSHTFMALQAAIHGQGVVLVNELLAKQEMENGNLQAVLACSIPDPKSFYLVNHLDQGEAPHIAAFRHWIQQTIRQEQQKSNV